MEPRKFRSAFLGVCFWYPEGASFQQSPKGDETKRLRGGVLAGNLRYPQGGKGGERKTHTSHTPGDPRRVGGFGFSKSKPWTDGNLCFLGESLL